MRSALASGLRSNRSRNVEGFDTIDEAGCLIVRSKEGKRTPIAAGEVYFGAAASVGAA